MHDMTFDDAKVWLTQLFAMAKDQTMWGIPRSGTVYRIDTTNKVLWRVSGHGDVPTEEVANAIGWSIK